MNVLRKLVRIFIIRWGDVLQYRTDLLLWTVTGAIEPLISLAVWYSVSLSSPKGFSPQEVLVYYIALTLTATITVSWHSFFVSGDILQGGIVKHLIRPVPYMWHIIANNLVEKIIRVIALLAVLVIAIVVFPQLFTLITSEIVNIPLYIASLILAIFMTFTLENMLGFMAFWLEESNEIVRFKFLLESVASGVLIPYAFMSDTIRNTLSILPFRYMFAAPVEILLGQLTGPAITNVLLIQSGWIAVLIVINYVMWVKGLKRYAVPGQ